jgi:hypothetical protein
LVRRGLFVGRDAKVEGRAGGHLPSTSGTLSDQPTACRNRPLRRLTGGLVSWGPERRAASPNNVRYWHELRYRRCLPPTPKNRSIPITAFPPTGYVASSTWRTDLAR